MMQNVVLSCCKKVHFLGSTLLKKMNSCIERKVHFSSTFPYGFKHKKGNRYLYPFPKTLEFMRFLINQSISYEVPQMPYRV